MIDYVPDLPLDPHRVEQDAPTGDIASTTVKLLPTLESTELLPENET